MSFLGTRIISLNIKPKKIKTAMATKRYALQDITGFKCYFNGQTWVREDLSERTRSRPKTLSVKFGFSDYGQMLLELPTEWEPLAEDAVFDETITEAWTDEKFNSQYKYS